jgi:predicted site-specific integrase-resolvase
MNDTEGEYLSIKETRKILGVTTPTLRKWAETDKVRFTETPTGRKLYNKQDIYSIANITKVTKCERKKIAYCRVSSQKQKDDLNRQKEFFRLNYPEYHVVTDIGSGINWKRKGLQTILEQSMSGEVQEIMVAHRDRLCRFAFELIEWILRKNNVKLTVLNDYSKEPGIDQELSDDIMSIIHVYSCRQMGKRRYSKNKSKVKETEDLSESSSEERI